MPLVVGVQLKKEKFMKSFIFAIIATFIFSGSSFGGECLNGVCNLRSKTVKVTKEIVAVPVEVTRRTVEATRNVGRRTVARVRNVVR
jgi:hypothetical protein